MVLLLFFFPDDRWSANIKNSTRTIKSYGSAATVNVAVSFQKLSHRTLWKIDYILNVLDGTNITAVIGWPLLNLSS